MSRYQPYQSLASRGSRGRGGGHHEYWVPPQHPQNMYYNSTYFTGCTNDSSLYVNYPDKPPPHWHHPQPRGNTHPRGGSSRNRYQSPGPTNPCRRPKVEVTEDSSKDRDTNHNQNPQNQTSNTSSPTAQQTLFRNLAQQIKVEEPYYRSGHDIEDVLRVMNSDNDQNIPCRSSNEPIKLDVDIIVNNPTTELEQNSNQVLIIDLTENNDDTSCQEESRIGIDFHNNKENTNVNTIVCEPRVSVQTKNTQEVSKNKKAPASNVNTVNSPAVSPLVLRKSNGNTDDWSIKKSTVSSRVNSGAAESLRTVPSIIIENKNTTASDSNGLGSPNSSSNGSSSKTQDPNSASAKSRKEFEKNTSVLLDKRRDFCSQACFAENTVSFVTNQVHKPMESTSTLAAKLKINKPGPRCSKPRSHNENNIKDNIVVTEQSTLSLESDYEANKEESEISISDVTTNSDNKACDNILLHHIDNGNGNGNSDVVTITHSKSMSGDSGVGDSEKNNFSEKNSHESSLLGTTAAISANVHIISDNSSNESDIDNRKKSDLLEDSSDENISSTEMSNLSYKRKNRDSEIFIPKTKKPRPIVESDDSDDDIIIISDEESEHEAVNPVPSTSKNSSNKTSKLVDNVLISKVTTSKLNNSDHRKMLSKKSTKTFEDEKSVHKLKSEHKLKRIPSSSVLKRAPEKVHTFLSTSSWSRKQGQQSHIIKNSKKLVVLLKRLSTHEISKFSMPMNVIDKCAVLYRKDVLQQIKYFISFIENLNRNHSKISLTTDLDDPKELCNQPFHYSNRTECALVELKYLQSDNHKITYKTLSNPEFDIKKMYKSFLDFRKNSNKKLNQFTIFTNFELAIDNLKTNKVDVKHENGRDYLSVDEGHELHKKFVKCLTLYNLAKILHECIQQRKQKNFNTELIKKYHLALVIENIIKIHSGKNLNGKTIHEAKFHPNFIKDLALSDAAKELRRHLINMLCKPEQSMGFILTDYFGKDTNLDPYPVVDVAEVADVLISKNQAKLSILKDELKEIVGHVLEKIQNDIFGISKQFYNGIDLPGNLKQLRLQVMLICEQKEIAFMKFCMDYRISIENFCNDYPVHRLPNENGKKLFEEFFNIFCFSNIHKHIHLNQDIRKIDDEACLNSVQKEILVGLRSNNLGKDTFDSILKVISKNAIIRRWHKHPQPKYNIEFHSNVIDIFKKKLPKLGIILCVTKSLLLTNLIVKQLAATKNYIEDKECLFITNKDLLESTNDVLNAVTEKSTHLMVVEWNEPMEQNSRILNVFTELNNVVRNESTVDQKSIIIIVHQKDFLLDKNIYKITDEEHSFKLSEESRLKLLQAENISLQNRKLSLVNSNERLILDEYVPILLESTEVLSKLSTGKLSIGKNLVKPEGYTESLFKTQIKQYIIINPAIFHERIADVFIIRNIDRKNLEQFLPPREKILAPNDIPASMRITGRYILLGFNISPSFFDDYTVKNQDYNVHLLRYDSGTFVWENTSGNNKELLRNRLDNVDDLLKHKIEDVVTEGPKTIIICGESGSGKSVCLYNLARETKNLYKIESIDAHWSLQVNLEKTRLIKYIKKNINMALEKDFVSDFLCDYLQLDTVQRKILTMILKNQLKIKLSLFFDNFEELPPLHRDFIIKLLQELQVSYCEKIYVTSSLNTRSELEDALAVFAYTLEFSEVEKIQFLEKFWSKSFGENDFTYEAGNLIDQYSKTEVNNEDLTAAPLHLKMLAEIYKPCSDEDYICIKAQNELYKLYIKHKGVKDMKSTCLYSLHKILNRDQLETLKLHHKYAKKDFILPDDLRHRTFYEYFSAKWFGTHNQSLSNFSFISLLDSVSPLFLKTYLAELNSSDDIVKIITDFAANSQLNHLKMILTHCKNKILLSTIIRMKNPNAHQSIRFLLDHFNDTKDEILQHGEFKNKKYAESNVVKYVNRREKPKEETPLEVAVQEKNIVIACELLLKGANIDGIDKEFISDIAEYVANHMCNTDSKWLHPIAEKLFRLRPDAVTHLDKTKKYPRLLSYFYTHGRVELINLLLKNNRERYDILVAKVDSKTPLDLVNESRVLSDDERLEIAKYIVSNVGEDLERKNKYYLADVLKAAAECNHERTFEYFIGKYPDKHMGFLENAMRSNRLNLIRFLMRKTDRMMYPDENTALHKAVSLKVSPMTIKFLVNRGGIDNKNKFGETPLCIAFKEGQDFEVIEYLIKRDAHLFTKDELGLYPWCYVILEDSKYTFDEQMYIMNYLENQVKLIAPETEQKISFDSDKKRKEVSRKLNFFQKRQDLISIKLELHIALKSNNENWIKFLILQGANVNYEDDGQTPLHIAIDFKRYKLAKMLLDHGAMFNAKNKYNKTPLQLIVSNGDDSKEKKEIEVLLETAQNIFDGNEKYSSQVSRHLINCRDVEGQSLLHIVAKNGNLSAIRDIIKRSKNYCIEHNDFPSIDVNAKDAKGQTPLYLVKKNNIDVVNSLLLNGAIFEPATTPLLQSANKLIQAVKVKDLEKVKELVKNECLVNAKDESGKNCLHYAAKYDCTEIMKVLLAVKVSDVDSLDSELQTPLHYAVKKNNIECMVLLLKAGASYDFKNNQGIRSFDLIDKSNESLKLMKKIHEMFIDIKSDQPKILDNENPDALIEYLLDIEKVWHVSKDIVVNVVDCKKNTLLHIATRYDFIDVVENLLRQGAIFNVKNRERKSPESMALSSKYLFRNVSEAFYKFNLSSWINLDSDFVVNLRSNNGYTLLYHCAHMGKKEEVRWLIENGADLKATSSRGYKITCNKNKYPEVYEMLQEFQD